MGAQPPRRPRRHQGAPVPRPATPKVSVAGLGAQAVERRALRCLGYLLRRCAPRVSVRVRAPAAPRQLLEPHRHIKPRGAPLSAHGEQRSRSGGRVRTERIRAGLSAEGDNSVPPSPLSQRAVQGCFAQIAAPRRARRAGGVRAPRPRIRVVEFRSTSRSVPVQLQYASLRQLVPWNGRRRVGGQLLQVVDRSEQPPQPHVPGTQCAQDRNTFTGRLHPPHGFD